MIGLFVILIWLLCIVFTWFWRQSMFRELLRTGLYFSHITLNYLKKSDRLKLFRRFSLIMSKQKTLNSFFKPVTSKRVSTDTPDDSSEETSQKKPRLDDILTEDTSGRSMKVEDNSQKSTTCTENQTPQKNKLAENDSNVLNVLSTPPNKPQEKKVISTPLGMLTPLQCLAKIKSQCAKTPALHPSIGETWFFALHAEFQKPYFSELSKFVSQEYKQSRVFPPLNQVWTWTTKVPIKDIKVVILGQDPYHNPGQAHGLCFSVPKGVPPPPSLTNMYKELQSDIPGFVPPKHGYLEGWADQGVLLLNACLTVRCNAPNSHKDKGWEQLTDAVIKYLSENGRNIVFLLWGSYAQKKGAVVDKKKHHILKTVHPSPLSAHRGFLGCKHFSQCNELLKKAGKKPIDWSHLP